MIMKKQRSILALTACSVAFLVCMTLSNGQTPIGSRWDPGIDMDAARWLTDRKVSLIGADNWTIEVWPHPDPDQFSPVHQWTITRRGVYHLENMNLEELAADKVYEFAFVFAPLPLKGATGSPGNPIALR